MRLSELVAYAKTKYNVVERTDLAGFPGVSILVEHGTGRWLAVLLRPRDPASGKILERCDLKCGRQRLTGLSEPWISLPFWLAGQEWVGLTFNNDTKRELVYKLFDMAFCDDKLKWGTIVLEPRTPFSQTLYSETPLPFQGARPLDGDDESIPLKIRQMRQLYEYGDGSFWQKCRNFYTQGKFMEDYEDDFPWHDELKLYLPTYRELRTNQLRGYFTWRAQLRKGKYQKICDPMVYLYLYELINGIGVSSVEEALQKMATFETEYIDAGLGSTSMRANLRQWALDLAIVNGLAPERAREYLRDETRAREEATAVLRAPQERSEREIFDALNFFNNNKIASSIVVQKHGDDGMRLFAQAWRCVAAEFRLGEKSFFTTCFGAQRAYRWRPFGNAIYYERRTLAPTTYFLYESHEYVFRDDGVWMEKNYQPQFFDKKTFDSFLRETDRRLRLYLKTGRPRKAREEDAWAAPYVEKVIDADRQARLDAAKPKVVIQFDDLERIRRDALATQDSLLTDADLREQSRAEDETERLNVEGEPDTTAENGRLAREPDVESGKEALAAKASVPLDDDQRQTLRMLLRGESVQATIAAKRWMPEVVADALNEALFDELGDAAVECDGKEIRLVEEYRDEIVRILGEEF